MTYMINAEDIGLTAETLSGDITSWLIDRLRTMECAYRYLAEKEQMRLIQEASNAALALVSRVVETIAASGNDHLPVTVKKVVNTGDEIQATITCGRTASQRHALFDAAGFAAVLTIADPERFTGGDLPQAKPDQPELV